jgi:hypothetical protein
MSGHLMSLFPENENGTDGPDKHLRIYICSSCKTTIQDMECINHRDSKWTVVYFLKHDNDIIVNQDTRN